MVSTAKDYLESQLQFCADYGTQFVQHFYPTLDYSRSNVLSLYRENSLLHWSGTEKRGLATLGQFFQHELPPVTRHSPLSVSCQPILHPQEGPTQSPTPQQMMLTVSGEVSFEVSGSALPSRPFSHLFILTREGDSPEHFYISQDCFRFQDE